MTKQQIINAVISVVEEMRGTEFVPNPETRYKPGGSTGNLAFNALQYKIENRRIVVYFDTKLAPYIPYTNEPWLSPFWEGKQNPNEGWWDRFAAEFADRLNKKLRGKMK